MGGCDYAQMLKLFSQRQRETAFYIRVFPVMSENRFSENDLGGPGRWQWGAGTVSRRGLRRRQWQEGALKSEPGQIGKGQHPAHGTQRRGPGGSGFHTGSAGQSAPAPSPPERDFRFRICPSLEPLTCEWLFHLENRSDPKSRDLVCPAHLS